MVVTGLRCSKVFHKYFRNMRLAGYGDVVNIEEFLHVLTEKWNCLRMSCFRILCNELMQPSASTLMKAKSTADSCYMQALGYCWSRLAVVIFSCSCGGMMLIICM